MDYENTYEREIDLKELMFAVLRKWRPILAAAVVLALLLGGFKAVSAQRSLNSAGDEDDSYAAALEEYEQKLEICNREIDNLTSDIVNLQKYVEDSILMNTSPYDVWEAKAELFVETDKSGDSEYGTDNLTATVMRAYQSALTSGELLSEIGADMGMEERYLQELITVTIGLDDYYRLDDLMTVQNRDNGFTIRNQKDNHYIMQDNLLTIQVRHKDEEEARKLLTQLLDGMELFQDRIRSGIALHTVKEISNSVSSKVDLSLADQQSGERDRLNRLNASLEEKKKELEDIKSPEAQANPVSSGIKYGGIGGVLGAFMAVFFVCIGFVMSDKVYSAKELKYRFKIKILGRLPLAGGKAGRIDKWLNGLEGRASGDNEDEEYGLISANICNYMEGARSLLVIGSAAEPHIDEAVSQLSSRLPGIKVMTGGNLLKDARGLKKLPECDGVILIEQCGKSLYSDVEQEIEKASDLQKLVVGCIVFE